MGIPQQSWLVNWCRILRFLPTFNIDSGVWWEWALDTYRGLYTDVAQTWMLYKRKYSPCFIFVLKVIWWCLLWGKIDSSFCNLCVDYVVLSILKGGIIIFRCKSEKKIDWDTNILWLVSLFIKEFPKSTLRVSYRGGIIWQAKILHMICIIGCIFIYMFYVIQQKWDYISEILISIQKVL